MKINAATRIKAAAKQDLLAFISSLSAQQQSFFFSDLLKYIEDWYEGSLNGKQPYDPSMVIAAKQSSVDLLALSLSYLRKIYPVQLPEYLYRITSIDKLPKGINHRVEMSNQYKRLLSFSALPAPIVADREPVKGFHDIILKWKPEEDMVVSSTESLYAFALDLRELTVEGSLEDYLPNNLNYSAYAKLENLHKQLARFRKEKEFTVFLKRSIECTWRLDDTTHN